MIPLPSFFPLFILKVSRTGCFRSYYLFSFLFFFSFPLFFFLLIFCCYYSVCAFFRFFQLPPCGPHLLLRRSHATSRLSMPRIMFFLVEPFLLLFYFLFSSSLFRLDFFADRFLPSLHAFSLTPYLTFLPQSISSRNYVLIG